jgi:hypothetical protein
LSAAQEILSETNVVSAHARHYNYRRMVKMVTTDTATNANLTAAMTAAATNFERLKNIEFEINVQANALRATFGCVMPTSP